MFAKLFGDKEKKTRRKIEYLRSKALFLQRNGKLREYGTVMVEIHELEKRLESTRAAG